MNTSNQTVQTPSPRRRIVTVVVDLQYGSTGKGLLAGYLARRIRPDTIVTAWCPNAGHTFVATDGRKYVHTMLANGIVANTSIQIPPPGETSSDGSGNGLVIIDPHEQPVRRVMLGPGSCINLTALYDELRLCADHLRMTEIVIHENAAIVDQRHRDAEKSFNRTGSTCKGSAESLIEKMRRDPQNDNITARDVLRREQINNGVMCRVVTNTEWLRLLQQSRSILVEGAQGYGLSLNHGVWPYVTSRDCTTARTLADCGIPVGSNFADLKVWGVARTLPIRVSNRHHEQGGGTSGPCMRDQVELDWSSLGRTAELTTVTKLPRRIFSFSQQQFSEALLVNGVTNVFLNFMNYLTPEGAECRSIDGKSMSLPSSHRFVRDIAALCAEQGADLSLFGVGPSESDLV